MRGGLPALALIACLLLQAGLPAGAAGGYAGENLEQALQELRAEGLKIVFTTEVVRPEMIVENEPVATEPRLILDELLEPHGLMARDGPQGTLVIVIGAAGAADASLSGRVLSADDSKPVAGAAIRLVESGAVTSSAADGSFIIEEHPSGSFTLTAGRAGFAIATIDGLILTPGQRTELSITLAPAPITEEQVEITPSRISLLRDEPRATFDFSRDRIRSLPHLGDDLFRALSLLPGVAANDVSAQFNVRGGRRDETQILLDGQELYEAYHLKDFDSALSFVAASNLSRADLSTGGYAAEYGDRMAGVLDMKTVTPSGPAAGHLSAAVLNLQAGGSGGFAGERGSWLFDARRGTIDLARSLLGKEHPQYADAYGKLEYRIDDRNSIRFNMLYSDDRYRFSEIMEEESKSTRTDYSSAYFWVTHRLALGNRMFVETALSRSLLDQDRRGVADEEDVEFDILDRRESEILALRQGWLYKASDSHLLKWGFELRRFDTEYDYAGSFVFDNPLAAVRHGGEEGETLFSGEFTERHYNLYFSDRIKIADPLMLEIGIRHDKHSLNDESYLSPRLNCAWKPGRNSVIRFAYGLFHQSQRPYELQVEDGETSFYLTERSEHWILGFERTFGGELAFRAELYQRTVRNPRPRFENLYETLNTFQEVEPDRVRVAPDRAIAEGIELFLQGRAGKRIGWWINYSLARSEDKIDEVGIPRGFDQRHTLNLDLDYRAGRNWRLNIAWRYHSGWPTTPLFLEEETDELGNTNYVPVLGPLNSRRLSSYHRMDVRALRELDLRHGKLMLFIDIQNLYDRQNVAGFDTGIDVVEGGQILAETEYWAGILPSAGLTYRF
jgi:outer membrane receptor for ferrienterochelin and colicin